MRGQGFGFSGSSPPWPYVGRGRGGKPRCQYPGNTVTGQGLARGKLQNQQLTNVTDLRQNDSDAALEQIAKRIYKIESKLDAILDK
jgi:hypothetical protein